MNNFKNFGLKKIYIKQLISTFIFTSITLLNVISCEGNVPDDLLMESEPTGLIFVKTPRSRTLNSFSRGGNLYSLVPASSDGKLTNLTNLESGDVADPEISYDGLKVLFSMRKSSSDNWHIYEMNIDGSHLRQITNAKADDFDPTYLPNGKIIFTSNRPGFIDEYNRQKAEVLHRMNADGSDVEQISFNLSDDFDPIVLRDGHVAYTRWEHHGTMNRFPVFNVNPDGCAAFVLFGPHNRNFFHVRELPDGDLIGIMSRRVNGDAGALAILHLNEFHSDPPSADDRVNITEQIVAEDELNGPPFSKGAFKYPVPLPDGRIMVCYASGSLEDSDETDWGLYTIKRSGKELALFYNDPKTNEFDAVVIAPRPVPPIIPETIDHSVTTGLFLDKSVYFRQTNDGQEVPDPGEIKQIMVYEGIPMTSDDRDLISLTSFERKRILGIAPVYEDGSCIFRVPVNTPISVNTLDSLGRSVVSKRTWFYIRPGEPMGVCIGCHSPRGQTQPGEPYARNMAPMDLTPSIENREIIDFKNALAPIIDQKCVSCHNGSSTDTDLNLSLEITGTEGDERYPIAYRSLLSSSTSPRLVRAPFSRRSYLADRLLGVDDAAHLGKHPINENALTQDELRKFITWIDLGAQYR